MIYKRSEGQVTGSKLVDSSVWIAHISKGNFEKVFSTDDQLFLSVISLFEIWKKLIKDKISQKDVDKTIQGVKEKSILLPVSEEIAERAVTVSVEKNLPMADALIYATATVHNVKLITCDNDFRGLENVEILEI